MVLEEGKSAEEGGESLSRNQKEDTEGCGNGQKLSDTRKWRGDRYEMRQVV